MATRIFVKALTSLLLFRLLIDWSLSRVVMAHHNIALPRSWAGKLLMAPSFLANHHVDAYFIAAIVGLLVVLVLRFSYFGNIFVFWIAFNTYTINLPFGDGSDVVLLVLTFWSIPLTTVPALRGATGRLLQQTAFNSFRFLCQLQIVVIYLLSGLDKLTDETWRSGEAFDYMRNFDALYNPVLPAFLHTGFWDIALSWATFLFEVLFFLVWARRLKWVVLLGGVLLHLGIWVVLSLPDFALVMITSYLVFLEDGDYENIRNWVRRWLR